MTLRNLGLIQTALWLGVGASACGPSNETGDGGDGGTSDDGGTGTDVCSEYLDADEIGPPVTITIRNGGTDPAYLTQALNCGSVPLFGLTRQDPVAWHMGSCSFTCERLMQGGCACPDACQVDTVIRIDPGGHYEATWPGNELIGAELPQQCATDQCGDQCWINRQAPVGEYTASVEAGSDFDCAFETCDCTQEDPDAGWCTIAGTITGETRQATAMLNYPGSTAAEIVLE